MAFTAGVNDEWEREKILAAVFHSLSFASLFFLAASTPSINFFFSTVYCVVCTAAGRWRTGSVFSASSVAGNREWTV